MAPHSSTLAWKIPWTEEPGGLQSMGSLRVRHDCFSLRCIGEGNGNPLQCSCLENPRDGGAWWSAIYGVTQSRTQLKRLSSSSSSSHVQLFATPWTLACRDPLSIGFSRQEYWRGLPFPSPGYLPNPGIDPRSPTLQASSLPAEPQGKPKNTGVGSLSSPAAAAAKSQQLCPTLCDPIDGSLPDSSVHGIFQARVLEWGAIVFSSFPY